MKLNASAENFLHSLLMPTPKAASAASTGTVGKMDQVKPTEISKQRSYGLTTMNLASVKTLESAKLTPLQQAAF